MEAIALIIGLIIVFVVSCFATWVILYGLFTDFDNKNRLVGAVLAFIGSIAAFWLLFSDSPGWDRTIGKISSLFS
jgi:ABC-type maltose transport system permease subunit